MTAEAWTIIGTGIAILVAIGASNRSIRAEVRQLGTRIDRREDRINNVEGTLTERITLDVMRDSIFDRHDVA